MGDDIWNGQKTKYFRKQVGVGAQRCFAPVKCAPRLFVVMPGFGEKQQRTTTNNGTFDNVEAGPGHISGELKAICNGICV